MTDAVFLHDRPAFIDGRIEMAENNVSGHDVPDSPGALVGRCLADPCDDIPLTYDPDQRFVVIVGDNDEAANMLLEHDLHRICYPDELRDPDHISKAYARTCDCLITGHDIFALLKTGLRGGAADPLGDVAFRYHPHHILVVFIGDHSNAANPLVPQDFRRGGSRVPGRYGDRFYSLVIALDEILRHGHSRRSHIRMVVVHRC